MARRDVGDPIHEEQDLGAGIAFLERVRPAWARQDSAVTLVANTPRVAGHLRSALEAGNWWAVAGWSLRAVDIALLEIGHLRHDEAQDRAAREHWARAYADARDRVPDDHDLSARAEVLGRWRRTAPGADARGGTIAGAILYAGAHAGLRVHPVRTSRRYTGPPDGNPGRARRLAHALVAAAVDVVRFTSPWLPDRRGQ